jgi:hypothetical protein
MRVQGDWIPPLLACLAGAGLIAWGGTASWSDYRIPAEGVPTTALVTAAHVPDPGKGPAVKVVSYEYSDARWRHVQGDR